MESFIASRPVRKLGLVSNYDDVLGKFKSHAAIALPPIVREASTRFQLSNESEIDAIGMFLARAYMAGVDAGMTEAAAQVVAQGRDVQVKRLSSSDGALTD